MIKSRLFKVLNTTAFLFFISNSFVFGQVTGSSASGRDNTKTQEVEQSEARYNQIAGDAGRYFKQGLLNMQDNRRPQAGEDFDKAIEVFLLSGVNVQSNQKLR